MTSRVFASCALALLIPALPVAAQEKERVFCDPKLPANGCPGVNCLCIDDTLEVTFDGGTTSTLVVDSVGAPLDVVVMTETVSTGVQGWAYGISHDEDVLMLTGASIEDTDAKAAFRAGFDATTIEQIESCTNPADPKCAQTRPGGGWISAVVLALTEPARLPVKRNSLAVARYTVRTLPGEAGTVLGISNRLKRRGSPPVQITFTISGKAKMPRRLVDGHLQRSPLDCPDSALYFGPVASEGDVIMEKDRALSISLLSKEPITALSIAVKTPLAPGSPWELAHQALGQSENRLVQLEMIDALGVSHLPATPNRALSPGQRPVRIERGSAVEPFAEHDYLVYDVSPAFGGPGFIAAYITDLGASPEDRAVIVPPPGAACGVSEVLRVIPGDADVPFMRGDGDGNGRITILDAILAVPIGPRLPAAVECDDAFDADDDGRLTVRDVIVLVQFLFQNGPDFPPPFPACSADETNDPLECAESPCR